MNALSFVENHNFSTTALPYICSVNAEAVQYTIPKLD